MSCQKWDLNPRLQGRLRPERSALYRSAMLTSRLIRTSVWTQEFTIIWRLIDVNKVIATRASRLGWFKTPFIQNNGVTFLLWTGYALGSCCGYTLACRWWQRDHNIVPWPGIEPGPRRWERRILTTRPSGRCAKELLLLQDSWRPGLHVNGVWTNLLSTVLASSL